MQSITGLLTLTLVLTALLGHNVSGILHYRLHFDDLLGKGTVNRIRELVLHGTRNESMDRPSTSRRTAKHDDQARIHVFTYANSEKSPVPEAFCRMVRSALVNNVPVQILGWGQPWSRQNGMIQKVSVYHIQRNTTCALIFSQLIPLFPCVQVLAMWNQVHSLPSLADIVTFTDAYDVLWIRSSQHLMEQFKTIENHSEKHLLFSAECACFPLSIGKEGRKWCQIDYPPIPTNVTSLYRFLNSGLWMGRVWAARAVLDQVILELVDTEPASHYGVTNDQLVLAKLWVDRKLPHFVGLDYESQLFQNMNSHNACDPQSDVFISNADNNWYHWKPNNKSTAPAVLHFPGEAKEIFYRVEAKSWWYNAMEQRMASLPTDQVPVVSHENHSMLNLSMICNTSTFDKIMNLNIHFRKNLSW